MGAIFAVCMGEKSTESKQEYNLEPSPPQQTASEIRRILSFKDFKGFKKIQDINEHYKFQETLGKGSFGEVKKAEHIKAQIECAVKIIKKKAIEKHQILVDLMHSELKVLEETTHPNIMRIFELFEDENCYYIASELLKGGELYERIVKMKHFNEQNAAFVVYQVLLALSYMHQYDTTSDKKIIHRDIKPENILLESQDTDNLNVKITDFGFACFYDKGEGRKEVLGSPLYMAPEIVNEEAYDQKVDIWSTGVIAYILLSGRPPFRGKTKQEIFQSITNNEVQFDHSIWEKVSDEAKDFITRALTKTRDGRPEAQDLLDHEWIQKQVKQPDVQQQVQLDIAHNLQEFRSASIFQSGVLSFIVNLKATSEELEELKQMFFKLDTSRDGKLTLNEIKSGMENIQGLFKVNKHEYEDLMRSIDKDGNGVIDYQEFITAAIDKAALLNKQNLRAAFELFDSDGSGLITVDELKAVFDGQGDKKDGSLWEEIMSEVDKNNDNQISFEEFTDVMTEILKKQHLNN